MEKRFLLLFFPLYTFCYSQNLIPDSSFADNIINDVEGSLNRSNYWKLIKGKNTGLSSVFDFRRKVDSLNFLGDRLTEIKKTELKKIFNGHTNFFELYIYLQENKYATPKYDIVGCKLASTLEKDSIYRIQILLLGKVQGTISNTVQVLFSKKEILKSSELKGITPIQLCKSDSSMLLFSNKWDTLSTIYKANGREQYFYIGNINLDYKREYYISNKKGEMVISKKTGIDLWPQVIAISYLIDDISIQKISKGKK